MLVSKVYDICSVLCISSERIQALAFSAGRLTQHKLLKYDYKKKKCVTLNIEDFKSIVWWCVHWYGFLIAEMVIMAPNCLHIRNIHYICVFVRCYYSKWVMLHSFYQTFYQLHASAGNWQQEMLLIWQLAPSTYLIIILVVVVVFCLKFYFVFILNAFFKDSSNIMIVFIITNTK